MRIAIDGRALTGRFTGDRTYWRGLLKELPNGDEDMQYLVYSREAIPAAELPSSSAVRAIVVPAANDRIWTLIALPAALRRDGADLIHVQYTTPPRALCPCPVVTTVHDISFKLYPEWFPRKDRILLNLTIPGSLRQAVRVITDSDSSRMDILRAYGLPPAKVVSVPLGVNSDFTTSEGSDRDDDRDRLAKYKIDRPYLLAVGVLQPRKNLTMLCEAFGRARQRGRLPHRLVIAGKAGWSTEQETLRSAARAGGGEAAAASIHFPGYIGDSDLPALYREADVFAYPSLYEGFGLPPIEAMACGTPVLVSDAPALPEVVGDAARILPAADIEAWSVGLEEMLSDYEMRRRYAELGPGRASCFSWKSTADRTREVYREAVCNSG